MAMYVTGGILPLVRTERKGKEVGGDRYSGPQHSKNLLPSMKSTIITTCRWKGVRKYTFGTGV